MTSLLLAMAFAGGNKVATPVLMMDVRGNIFVAGKPYTPRYVDGARKFQTSEGSAYVFNAKKNGVHFEDLAVFKLTGSMTISAWVCPKSYVNEGPQAQILFRGDDRSGLDPYQLCLHDNGTITFDVENAKNESGEVGYKISANRWTHVVASLDAKTGEMSLWEDGEKVATAKTSVRPFANLDAVHAPGVSVGNVPNENGIHNQPFNGLLADVRLYSVVMEPEDVGYIMGQSRSDIRP